MGFSQLTSQPCTLLCSGLVSTGRASCTSVSAAPHRHAPVACKVILLRVYSMFSSAPQHTMISRLHLPHVNRAYIAPSLAQPGEMQPRSLRHVVRVARIQGGGLLHRVYKNSGFLDRPSMHACSISSDTVPYFSQMFTAAIYHASNRFYC